jgi:hypothetical protein
MGKFSPQVGFLRSSIGLVQKPGADEDAGNSATLIHLQNTKQCRQYDFDYTSLISNLHFATLRNK